MIVEYLEGKTFHELTCCHGGTALKFMELIQTIRSQMFVKADYVARLLISYINGTENT